MDKNIFSAVRCIPVYFFWVALFQIFFADINAQPSPKREMRAVWIATVNNIDWPSAPGLTPDQQKRELSDLLDMIKGYNLNTVVFQVRPAADALYESSIEPWSQWLTGKQGLAPDPFYDPLEFVIAECRKRSLDIHAWLNPYRAVKDTSDITAENHITKIHPEWFLTYGRTVYFDPGLQETRDYVASVVSDIVRRYDIDAVHMDDYFYPYRIANVNFPDDSSFYKNPRGFSADRRDYWRRDNVNLIIKQLSDSIKTIKPWVEFGISPFGVWRNSDKDPGGSETKAGQTNYDDLFADVLYWQKNGWIDYIVPQIYWHIGFTVADYKVLADWWSRNAFGCRIYVGQAAYRIAGKASAREWRTSSEIIRQVKLNRTIPTITGSMYFSARSLRNNPLNLSEKLTKDLYRYTALSPVNSRIVPIVPDRPSSANLVTSGKTIRFSWEGGDNTKNFVLYKFRRGNYADMNNPGNLLMVTSGTSAIIALNRKTDPGKYIYLVTAISRTNTESEPEYFKP